MRRLFGGILVGGLLVGGILGPTGCGGSPEGDETETVERSVFVAAYVDLRIAALRSGGAPDEAQRQAILDEHGVTRDDLLEFAEVHGRDPAYMRNVWGEVEQKLDSARIAEGGSGADTAGGGDPPGGGAPGSLDGAPAPGVSGPGAGSRWRPRPGRPGTRRSGWRTPA